MSVSFYRECWCSKVLALMDNRLFREGGIMQSESQLIIFPHSKHVGSQQTVAMINLHNQFGHPGHAIDLMRQTTRQNFVTSLGVFIARNKATSLPRRRPSVDTMHGVKCRCCLRQAPRYCFCFLRSWAANTLARSLERLDLASTSVIRFYQ